MSGKIEQLRLIYLELQKHCQVLSELSKSSDSIVTGTRLEEARQKLAGARLNIWAELQKDVMVNWCNETETPEPFSRFPPKDMPQAVKEE